MFRGAYLIQGIRSAVLSPLATRLRIIVLDFDAWCLAKAGFPEFISEVSFA